jgi:hypothetical protein
MPELDLCRFTVDGLEGMTQAISAKYADTVAGATEHNRTPTRMPSSQPLEQDTVQ